MLGELSFVREALLVLLLQLIEEQRGEELILDGRRVAGGIAGCGLCATP